MRRGTKKSAWENDMLKHISRMLAVCCILGVLAGCNTIAGAGRDIERGGEIIRDTARDVQKKM